MSETISPLPAETPASAPKTEKLAIWSLVLGILSLMCFFTTFASIPGVICGHKALSKIKRSGGASEGQGMAIAGLVTGYIGIAWTIVVIFLAAIAYPNFLKARAMAQTNACNNNLRMIDAAKTEWALENHKSPTDIPARQDLLPYLKNSQFPQCPAGGTYTVGQVKDAPTCSVPEHFLMVATRSQQVVSDRDTIMANACIDNLRMIEDAESKWAYENQKGNDDTPTEKDLLPYLKNNQMPQCPAGGTYTLHGVKYLPTCSVPGHELPGLMLSTNLPAGYRDLRDKFR